MAIISDLIAAATLELQKAGANCPAFAKDAEYLDDPEAAETFRDVQTQLQGAAASLTVLQLKAGQAHAGLHAAQDRKDAPGLGQMLERAQRQHDAEAEIQTSFNPDAGWSVQRIRRRVRTRNAIRFEERDWVIVRADRNDPSGIVTGYSYRSRRTYALRIGDVDWQGGA